MTSYKAYDVTLRHTKLSCWCFPDEFSRYVKEIRSHGKEKQNGKIFRAFEIDMLTMNAVLQMLFCRGRCFV